MSKRRNTWMPTARQIPKARNLNRDNDMMNKGWQLGLLSAAAVLNDVFDFSNEDMARFMKDCDVLMESMNRQIDDYDKIAKQLEYLTGIRLTLNAGEKPDDGRFAIIEAGLPEEDEYEEDEE